MEDEEDDDEEEGEEEEGSVDVVIEMEEDAVEGESAIWRD